MRHPFLSYLAVGMCLTLTACKTPPPESKPEAATVSTAPLDPATLGEVSGTVSFKGKPPAPLAIDVTMDPACSVPGVSPKAEQFVVKDGKLANVYLYVKSGPAAAMSAPAPAAAPVVLDQKGCVYTPHVVAIMRGGKVEFRNSDPTMHNIHTMPTTVGNEAVDISESAGSAPRMSHFAQAEAMIPVRCNNHPWMNAFINVSATPFFAVSDAAGHFDLHGLPAGDYTLGAVHEKLGEQTLQVTVKAGTTSKADFNFAIP